MNRYILIRRLYGPAFLLLTGVNALLSQADILGWGHSWPFYLILLGVLKLAERAALAAEGYPAYPQAAYPPYASAPSQPFSQPAQAAAQQAAEQQAAAPGTAIVSAPAHEIVRSSEGGQQ